MLALPISSLRMTWAGSVCRGMWWMWRVEEAGCSFGSHSYKNNSITSPLGIVFTTLSEVVGTTHPRITPTVPGEYLPDGNSSPSRTEWSDLLEEGKERIIPLQQESIHPSLVSCCILPKLTWCNISKCKARWSSLHLLSLTLLPTVGHLLDIWSVLTHNVDVMVDVDTVGETRNHQSVVIIWNVMESQVCWCDHSAPQVFERVHSTGNVSNRARRQLGSGSLVVLVGADSLVTLHRRIICATGKVFDHGIPPGLGPVVLQQIRNRWCRWGPSSLDHPASRTPIVGNLIGSTSTRFNLIGSTSTRFWGGFPHAGVLQSVAYGRSLRLQIWQFIFINWWKQINDYAQSNFFVCLPRQTNICWCSLRKPMEIDNCVDECWEVAPSDFLTSPLLYHSLRGLPLHKLEWAWYQSFFTYMNSVKAGSLPMGMWGRQQCLPARFSVIQDRRRSFSGLSWGPWWSQINLAELSTVCNEMKNRWPAIRPGGEMPQLLEIGCWTCCPSSIVCSSRLLSQVIQQDSPY